MVLSRLSSQVDGPTDDLSDDQRDLRGVPTVTAEKALQELSRPRSFPPYLEKRFGAENLKALSDTLTHPDLTVIDMLLIEEGYTFDQTTEYATVLDEIHELRANLHALAQAMAEEYAKGQGQKEFERAISNAFDPTTGKLKSGRNPIVKILDQIEEVYRCASPDLDGRTYQTGRVHVLFVTLWQIMMLHIRDGISNYCPERVRDECLKNFDSLCLRLKVNKEMKEAITPNEIFGMHDHTYLVAVCENKDAFQAISSHITDVEDEETQERLNQKHSKVRELSNYRKIHPHEKRIGAATIRISGDENPNFRQERAQIICEVEIEFEGEAEAIDRTLYLWLDRSTGKLMINPIMIPFEMVNEITGQQAASLEENIYDILIGYLEAKDEDIAPCAIVPLRELPEETVGISAQVEEVRVACHEELHEEEPPQDESLEALETSVVDLAAEAVQEVTLTFEETIPTPTVTWAQVGRRKGNEVKKALDKLLGPPIRIRGSHHIYESLRDDVSTFPISFHGNHDVGQGLLHQSCAHYGITPEMLLEAF